MTRRRPPGFDAIELLDRVLTQLVARVMEDGDSAGPRPAQEAEATGKEGSPPNAEEQLASRALRAAHSLLDQLERSRPEDEKAVARLLAEPAPKRWLRATADTALHRPEMIELLLSAAGRARASERGPEAEETALLALHLCERLDPDSYPEGLVGDLLCRALAVRVEHLIAQRRLCAAEIALFRTQGLLVQSCDPLVAHDLGLASAWLHWAQGKRETAVTLLNDLGRLAAMLGDVDRVGELSLWCCLLFLELDEAEAAAGLEARAEDVLGAAAVKGCWAKVRAKHKALRLDLAPARPQAGSPSVH